MKAYILLSIGTGLLACLSGVPSGAVLGENQRGDGTDSHLSTVPPSDCVRFDFQYLIVSDEQMSPNTRKIEVFMDEKAFNENNLRKLFRHLSDTHPDPNKLPNNLLLYVYTDWKQLGTYSDCPVIAMSGGDGGRDAYDYYWARFRRREGREYFRYNPIKKVWNDKTVILKGDEIYENGAWQKPH
ncbi:MAG: hypothetical protein AB7Q37_05535 [Pyrinomonadaceae bacterium]